MLEKLDLSVSIKPKEYDNQLSDLQLKLLGLQRRIVERKIPVVVMFEGWDASGKGGAIKRLTEFIDPRGYRVWSISAPTPDELAHHYLWRFWTKLPGRGEIAIFDRSWYGRVLVERIEKYAAEAEWQRAFGEINCFEKLIVDDGTVLCKFWLEISEMEQGRRFEERSKDPYKRWKITEDDWRNREKRPQYVQAAEDMFTKTSTDWAPWTLVEAEDKKYARIKVLRTVVEAIEAKVGAGAAHPNATAE
jgi:polyphosphate kinase 2 (PPK2 family)